uniref:DNA-directed RNA polymerase n=1 Tax=Physcomitrium patens TaxID=3218 RepID=A0A2K1JUW8_PHYPA|nr:hypothetical protein PHYPA_015086 [Physcomitrium patens]
MTKLLTFCTIKNIIKSIFISKGRQDTLMFLGSLQRIVDCWLLGEGLSIGYDDCINKILPGDRALAWCSPYDSSLQGQGFINSSYFQGLNPIEYFFYCQGDREGLVNIGVNTSDAGYIQRCISKSMQDVTI